MGISPIASELTLVRKVPRPKIYVLGGYSDRVGEFDGHHALSSAEVFDQESGTWRSLPPMNEGRARFASAATDDHNILVFGGYGGLPFPLASNEAFVSSAGVWARIDASLTPRVAHSAVVLDGKLYLIGGGEPLNHETLQRMD